MSIHESIKRFLDITTEFHELRLSIIDIEIDENLKSEIYSVLDFYNDVVGLYAANFKILSSDDLETFSDILEALNAAIKLAIPIDIKVDPTSFVNTISSYNRDFSLRKRAILQIVEIATMKAKAKDFEQELNKSRKRTEEIESLYNSSQKQFDELNSRITPFIEKVNSGITSQNFSSLANWNFISALVFGVLIIILIWCFGCYLGNYIINGCFEFKCLTTATLMYSNKDVVASGEKLIYLEIFKAVFYRLLIVSVALYLLKFLITNFKSSMHNYTINKHRAASIESSIFLIDRTNTAETKEQLLLLVANAIFAHQPTGYNDKEPENINFVEKVADKAFDALKK